MRMKILLTGGSGLLALNWAMALRDSHAVVLGLHQRQVSLPGVECRPIALASSESFLRDLALIKPDVVVHAAGITNVDWCETHVEQAMRVNAQMAGNAASACARASCKLVHISTDHLFNGAGSFATEQTPARPVNVYARSKLQGEHEVAAANPDALVLRTNFFGWGPVYKRSFSDMILDALLAQKRPTLFDDVYFTPILIHELVRCAMDLVGGRAAGVVHLGGGERLSKYEFGCQLATQFGFDPAMIERGSMAHARHLVCRPSDMSLSNDRARQLLRKPPVSVSDQLEMLQQQSAAGLAKEMTSL